ncbi:hypothetical protein [Streptomyces sp. AN091965]|uniref:hypothetical protein n=1 Tax=Streptomyces sp. AN091965 TaxID=2927803 RepID=UPI001F618A37|nr:hypothetical protein [Streptomyces sp. AN091965]MCI3932031.1 hypothetical protein [Streptomyces sp. AN091965]
MRKWWSAAGTVAWVAVGTAAGGLGAWQLASADGGGAAHSRPLDEGAVRRALTAEGASGPGSSRTTPSHPEPSGQGPSSPGPSSPSAGPSRSKQPTGAPRPNAPERSTVRFTGGSATVECRSDGRVYLVSWSPADGYHFDEDVVRGPGFVARLEAEPSDDADVAEDGDDLPYDITCSNGRPRARRAPDD